MKILIGGDHAGYDLKTVLLPWLLEKGFEVDDIGCFSKESCDYPDFAHPVARAIHTGKADMGILICGTANGVAIVANKYANVRAALVWNNEVAELVRLHNDANIICLPARFISTDKALLLLETFLNTAFEGGRHERRISKIPC